MNKYVIKNCPAYMYDKQFNRNVCKKNLIPYETCCEECQDITDCVMKKIVEKCREDWEDSTVLKFQRELLDMLEIEAIKKEQNRTVATYDRRRKK